MEKPILRSPNKGNGRNSCSGEHSDPAEAELIKGFEIKESDYQTVFEPTWTKISDNPRLITFSSRFDMATYDDTKAHLAASIDQISTSTQHGSAEKRKIKLLIADNSSAIRRLLSDIINHHDELELAYEAKNGSEALGAMPKCDPDVVVLEVDLPVMNGLETAAAIRALNPRVPIIMFSALTRAGAETTLRALARGASDFETKPRLVGHIGNARQHIVDHLIPKILRWGHRKYHLPSKTPAAEARADDDQAKSVAGPKPQRPADASNVHPEVIAIGASTGGPRALKEFLRPFPKNLDVPILIVQHMPPVFTGTMAKQLDNECQLNVHEAKSGSLVEPGNVYIAPGDYHMVITKKGADSVIGLHQGEKVHFCRPAVDVMFRSLPAIYGDKVLALVMTGMGKDGLEGAKKIYSNGGTIMCQDRNSSSVWGMPGEIYSARIATEVLPPGELAEATLKMLERKPVLS